MSHSRGLHVIARLVERFGDGDVDLLPPAQRVEDDLARLRRDVLVHARHGVEHAEHGLGVLALQLLRDGGDALHARAPVLELGPRARVAAYVFSNFCSNFCSNCCSNFWLIFGKL